MEKIKQINVNNIKNVKTSSFPAKSDNKADSKSEKLNSKLKTYGAVLASVGAVGLATFLILKKRGRIKASDINKIDNLKKETPTGNNAQDLKDNLKSEATKAAEEIKNKIQYDAALVAEEIPDDSSIYGFMKRNIRGFYLENGREINTFLRTGELKATPVIDESMPPALKKYAESEIKETKEYNRAIVDSIERLESTITTRAEKPMTLYRDAPASWLDTAENGILTDKAFCSTSVTPGASMEGIIGSNSYLNKRYEIRIPEGTPFLDLRHTSEREVLLPRNCKFKIIGENILELIAY